MLESVSGLASAYGRPIAPQRLSDSQKTAVQDILSEFDASNLSAEDAEAINAAFRAEGIKPSADLKSTIEAAGFDANELRPPGGPEGGGGRPPHHHCQMRMTLLRRCWMFYLSMREKPLMQRISRTSKTSCKRLGIHDVKVTLT
ncbi:MAG: hypothetical protein OQK24_10655 [Magnetovibrio sp.]|nr:hypothetical protein [Magnetovibrio sp.]